MRIRVTDILDLIQAGRTIKEITEELPDLDEEDVKAALAFVRTRVDHAIIAA